MSQELEHKVRELEEITDIPEPVIDLTEEDVVIDMPVEEKVSGELEEITGLQDITTSTLIIEDENPPLQILKGDDDIIDITAHVDAINTIKVVKHTKVHSKLQKEDRLFEDIPEPLHSSTSQKEESLVKDSYIDTTLDEENREIKGKIYYDKNIDALVIEDFSEDEELAQKEKEESKEVASGYEFEAEKATSKPLYVDEDNVISDEGKINRPEVDILTIEIPPEVRNKIEEKDIEDFQFINLDEAEQIASEDILILSEEDLIEELDEYDLIPIETTGEEKKSKEKKKEKVTSDVKVSPKKHEPEKKEVVDVKPLDGDRSEEVIIKPDKEKKKAEPAKVIQEEIIQKEESIDLKQEEISVTEEIIKEVPKIDTEIKEKPQDQLQPPSHETNIDIITLEEEKEFVPASVTTKETGDSFDTKNLIRDYAQFKIETIPDELAVAANQKIMIIDDTGVEVKDHVSMEENPIDDIDKLVSGMIEITEGEAKILKEASSKEEDEYIAPILTGTLPTFQDKMIEFEEEYKFKDDDIVFIDNAVLVDEYDKYLKVIDDYYETKAVKKSSSTVELFGLTKDEFEFFYDILFEKEYETIKASKAFKDITVGRDHPEKDATLVKQFKYIQAKPQSLSDKEKKSIEENIESPVAVVIEENIDDIVERLKKIKPQVDITKLLAQMPQQPSKLYDIDDSKSDIIIEEKPAKQEEITNITDQVIILDSKEDVNRFVDTLPVEKQENIRRLLKYLDSLFDKLPEDVIKNFANSEYFDLYVKVLNELGV
ncbi:MAG: hypothetical protein AB1444_03770 [Spirochaetota bacterium]